MRRLFALPAVVCFIRLTAAICSAQTPSDAVFNVKSFGAKGDGATNDFGSITQAMNAAASSNAIVFFPPGQYVVSETLRPPASITLKGAGWRSSFIKGASSFNNTGDSNNGNALIGITGPVNMVQVRDLGFVANGTALRGVKMLNTTDNVVEKCWFAADFEWACFMGSKSTSNRVSNIVSEGTSMAHNVEINDSSFNEVSNSHLMNSTGNNVEVYINTPGECVGNRIINNHLEGAKGAGVVVVGDQNTVISNNTIEAGVVGGFRSVSAYYLPNNEPSAGGTLIGNTFVNNGGTSFHGVILDPGSKGWTVKGNTIRKSGNCGMYIAGAAHSIEGNNVSESRRHGLYVRTSGHTLANNILIDNSSAGAGNADGMRVETSQCIITGNRCTDTRTPKMQAFGIGIIGGAAHIVTGNNLVGNRSLPIYDTSSGSTKANNITQ